jgi:Protein of unknown function (DUF4019)
MTRRRAWLVAGLFFLWAVVGIGAVSAQNPQASLAQKEARSWLMLTDRGDAAASWRVAGKQFQKAITADQWADSLRQVRPPLGALTDRTVLSTEFTRSFPGAPEGDYALLVFRSSFATKTDSRETVTLEREADGAWHVIGYFIR